MLIKIIYFSTLLIFYFTKIFLHKRSYDYLLCKYFEIDVDQSRVRRQNEFCVLSLLALVMPLKGMIVFFVLSCFLLFRDELQFMRKVRQLKEDLNYDFPIWLRFVQGSLSYDTVYKALKDSVDYASPLLQDDVYTLILALEKDPQAMGSYEQFLKEFENFEILRMMTNLYRYNFAGKDEAYKQLEMQVERCNKWIEESRMDAYERILSRYSWMSAIPMIAVTFLFIVLMFQMMVLMMEGGWTL